MSGTEQSGRMSLRRPKPQMGGQHHAGPGSNEDQKLDNLCPGQSKVEGCR